MPDGKYTGDREGYRNQTGSEEAFVPKGMNDETTRNRLLKSVKGSYEKLAPFRTLVNSLVEEYAGSAYGHGQGPRHEIYMNLMNQAVEAYTMALAANRPRVLVSTEYPELKYFSKVFESATNNLIKEIGIEQTIRRWVLDAFFCIGVVKVHMADAGDVEVETDLWMDPGKPFASNVSLDNFVYDMSAKKWTEIQYAGDSYRIPFHELKDEDIYDQSVVKELRPTSKFHQEQDRLEGLSRGQVTDPDEYQPGIDLMDIWIPRDDMIYTFAMDHVKRFEGRHRPVAEMRWDGPEFGPYHILSFNDVPENIMPTSPASHLNNLSKLANNIIRKQGRKARSARRIHTYPPASHKDAQKVQRASDDAWVEVQENGELREVLIGGIDPNNQAFLAGIIEMFDRMAGNLQVQAGLGTSAPTARQEQMIARHAGKKESQMQYRVVEASVSLIRDLGYMLWEDSVKEIPGKYPLEGTKLFLDGTWTPNKREGNFFDYNFDIDIFSMGYQAPDERGRNITEMVQMFAQFQEGLSAQGGQIDFAALLEMLSELTNEPRLKEIIKFGEMERTPPDKPGPSGKPTPKTTEHIRRNVPAEKSQLSSAGLQGGQGGDLAALGAGQGGGQGGVMPQ